MHGAISQEEMSAALIAADARYADWGFEEKIELCGSRLASALFSTEPIEWTRLGAYQATTMRLITERLLACRDGSTVGEGEITWIISPGGSQRPKATLPPPPPPCRWHLYVSAHNEGAEELVAELVQASGLGVLCTSAPGELEAGVCAHFLVLLDGRTWAARPSAGAFAAELSQAIGRGQPLLLAHEVPGRMQSGRHAVSFDTFFGPDSTPSELISAGIYRQIAVPLRGGALRTTGLALFANAIGPVGVARKPMRTSVQRGHASEPPAYIDGVEMGSPVISRLSAHGSRKLKASADIST